MSYTDFDFPHSDFYRTDLRQLIADMKKLEKIMKAFVNAEEIKFADPIIWNITKQYAKSTVVLDANGNAYLSKQAIPKGIQLNDEDYWQEIFNFADYVRTANSNLTVNIEMDTTRATHAYSIDDWLLYDDVLYKVTAAIAADDLLEVDENIEHFTVEDFIKAFMTWATNTIQQYKNDIDASELQYRQQLAQDIAATTASLQAQLNTAIADVTVDSEVINARVGFNNINYSTLGSAIREQIFYALSVINPNLYDGIAWTSGFIDNTGYYFASDLYYVSDFIKVYAGITYHFSAARFSCLYNNERVAVVGGQSYATSDEDHSITPSVDGYIRVTIYASDYNRNHYYMGLTELPLFNNLSNNLFNEILDSKYKDSVNSFSNIFNVSLLNLNNLNPGYVDNNGHEDSTATGYMHSNKIFIKPNTVLYTGKLRFLTFYGYDGNVRTADSKNFSDPSVLTHQITVPANCYYMIATVYADDAYPYINTKDYELFSDAFKESLKKVQLKINGLKVYNFGDSIAVGEGNNNVGYAKMLSNYGAIVNDYAVSGATLSKVDGQAMSSVLDQIESASDSAPDLIIIEGGPNDFTQNRAMGNLTEDFDFSAITNNATFIGALERVIYQLRIKYGGVKIIWVTTHKENTRHDKTVNNVYINFDIMMQLSIDAAKKWSVSVVDIYNEGQLNTNLTNMRASYTYNGDGTHPNERGYQLYYMPQLIAAINKIF